MRKEAVEEKSLRPLFNVRHRYGVLRELLPLLLGAELELGAELDELPPRKPLLLVFMLVDVDEPDGSLMLLPRELGELLDVDVPLVP